MIQTELQKAFHRYNTMVARDGREIYIFGLGMFTLVLPPQAWQGIAERLMTAAILAPLTEDERRFAASRVNDAFYRAGTGQHWFVR